MRTVTTDPSEILLDFESCSLIVKEEQFWIGNKKDSCALTIDDNSLEFILLCTYETLKPTYEKIMEKQKCQAKG